jgi:serine O-acetyltransferase
VYKEMIAYDKSYNASFRGFGEKLPHSFLKSYEWQAIVLYRKCQSNKDNIWCYFYEKKLDRIMFKTGIDFAHNYTIGKGLIIGHWGRIIINVDARFGNGLFLTHNVNIGRDIRGKRAGCPTFGDKVCIRGNSTVVGNIHIGNDVLIAPNTFVNFDVPDHSIVIGNPATIHHRDNATEGHLPSID